MSDASRDIFINAFPSASRDRPRSPPRAPRQLASAPCTLQPGGVKHVLCVARAQGDGGRQPDAVRGLRRAAAAATRTYFLVRARGPRSTQDSWSQPRDGGARAGGGAGGGTPFDAMKAVRARTALSMAGSAAWSAVDAPVCSCVLAVLKPPAPHTDSSACVRILSSSLFDCAARQLIASRAYRRARATARAKARLEIRANGAQEPWSQVGARGGASGRPQLRDTPRDSYGDRSMSVVRPPGRGDGASAAASTRPLDPGSHARLHQPVLSFDERDRLAVRASAGNAPQLSAAASSVPSYTQREQDASISRGEGAGGRGLMRTRRNARAPARARAELVETAAKFRTMTEAMHIEMEGQRAKLSAIVSELQKVRQRDRARGARGRTSGVRRLRHSTRRFLGRHPQAPRFQTSRRC